MKTQTMLEGLSERMRMRELEREHVSKRIHERRLEREREIARLLTENKMLRRALKTQM